MSILLIGPRPAITPPPECKSGPRQQDCRRCHEFPCDALLESFAENDDETEWLDEALKELPL